MSDLNRILSLAGLATTQSVAETPANRELKEQDGCPCCGGGRCTCPGDCPDCNCHGNNEWDESVEEVEEVEEVDEMNAAADAVIYRLQATGKMKKLLVDYGLDEVIGAIQDATYGWEEGDEIGSSDVSIWTRNVIEYLSGVEEGNAYTGALAKAKASGKDEFEVGGKTHAVKEGDDFMVTDPESAWAAISMRKKELMDMGMEPEEAQDHAAEEIGVDPEELEAWLASKYELDEADWCGVCGNDTCTCTDIVSEAPTMDTTQLVIMMRNAGLSEEVMKKKLEEWANTPAAVGEVEPTAHGDAYDFAQSVNLSLKRYLDAEDMKVQVKEHTVENMKALYESKKNKK